MEVKPFRPLIYRKEIDGMIAPPFDAITPKEEVELKRNKYNITYLTLPKGRDGIPHAKMLLQSWLENGVLIPMKEDVFIVLRQRFYVGDECINRYGLIAKVKVFPESGDVIPHERTFDMYVKERETLMDGISSQLEPIFLVTLKNDLPGYLKAITDGLKEDNTYFGPENVENFVYYINDKRKINKIISLLAEDKSIVADGHHRLQATKNIAARKSGGEREFWSYAMAYITSIHDPGVLVGGVNRVVSNKFRLDMNVLSKYFEINQVERLDETNINLFNGRLYSLKIRIPVYDNLIDASNDFILSKSASMNYTDIENEVIYTHDIYELMSLVNSGSYSFGIILPRWDKMKLIETLLSGRKLPQKSTYFYPKIPSGLAIDTALELRLS
ncbi:TVG1021365 [Thermoplasma volcanium GSS1]|uniref:TVG1021365 protein n=1 Tax=Thermoplasma volcanium (strain ATCC 51530 / DSM 4299 / JCM 9571 / NBRC 15438 / GSS1) TaxID=273116 RepID=Q97A10_THEVO|nr:DUF1015 family protein [Thermoplasma volcanium]BAB60142.1 TVG1021365 [Thermoplasma volcanium GSS1]